LCTVDFAADLLKARPRSIQSFIREGRLPARRIGKAYRNRRTDLATPAGLPSVPFEPAFSLTALLDVAHVGPEAAKLWQRTVATALASRGPTAPEVELIYDPDTRHLTVVIVGPPAVLAAILTKLKLAREYPELAFQGDHPGPVRRPLSAHAGRMGPGMLCPFSRSRRGTPVTAMGRNNSGSGPGAVGAFRR
jgi:hypothetical protein